MATKDSHYIERNGKLYARISFKDEAGNWKQKERLVRDEEHRPSTASKDLARTVRELQNEFDVRGVRSWTDKSSVDAFLDEWLAVKHSLRERTRSDYRSILRRYVRPLLGKKQITKIEPDDIQGLVNGMIKEGLQARTIQYMHTVLYGALEYAVYPRKLLTLNPAKYTELPQKGLREYTWLSEEAARQFLKALSKDKHGLLLEFALVTGMRPEEYLALQWNDIDWNRGMIAVERTLYRRRERADGGPTWRFEKTKTGKSRRILTVPRSLIKRLAAHKRQQAKERLAMGPKWITKDLEGNEFHLVFCTEKGSPLNLSNVHRRYFKPILEKAELPDIRLYDLRHSFASLLLEVESVRVVSEMLGHSSTKTTENIYQHVDAAMMRRVTDTLEKRLRLANG